MEAGSFRHNGSTLNSGASTLEQLEKRVTKGNKAAEIAVAISMIVLGLLILCIPVITGITLAYLVTIGFIIVGIYCIIKYASTPADYRRGWTLANGIIFTIFGVLVLAQALTGTNGQIDMISTIAFVIGFFALFQGISEIASYGAYKKSGAPGAGWLIASGIINILLGSAIIFAPMAGYFALQWVFGIYLVIIGIMFFAKAATGRLAQAQ